MVIPLPSPGLLLLGHPPCLAMAPASCGTRANPDPNFFFSLREIALFDIKREKKREKIAPKMPKFRRVLSCQKCGVRNQLQSDAHKGQICWATLTSTRSLPIGLAPRYTAPCVPMGSGGLQSWDTCHLVPRLSPQGTPFGSIQHPPTGSTPSADLLCDRSELPLLSLVNPPPPEPRRSARAHRKPHPHHPHLPNPCPP